MLYQVIEVVDEEKSQRSCGRGDKRNIANQSCGRGTRLESSVAAMTSIDVGYVLLCGRCSCIASCYINYIFGFVSLRSLLGYIGTYWFQRSAVTCSGIH
eukprot:scaffold9665_cov83-Skeletonema_dohrnii-CCMP3373.AAC.1